MEQSLADFISKRLAELVAREEPLRQELDEIVREIAQLRRAADAADISVQGFPAGSENNVSMTIEYSRRSIPERTIKDAVVEVLRSKPSGMTALEILAAIKERFSTDYPRTSLSPQLSRLRADGRIERAGGNVWRLTSRLINYVEAPQQPDLEGVFK